MSTELLYWQKRLESHFRELHSHRNNDQPIFGLEHCLNEKEVDNLKIAVRTHIAEHPPSKEHWLAWIVYTSEFGYKYLGDEYWQTFEEETPGWIDNGDRYWIRSRYFDFHEEFGGAKPSGAWAKHFSIICWPITHAILPKDLQRHLARMLYEARNSFSAEILESPAALGELVYNQSWKASSHFQNFARHKQLVGQIAAPLLLEGDFGTDSFIRSETLKRISKDLDSERRSREWIRIARKDARKRMKIKGLMPPWKNLKIPEIDNLQRAKKEIEKLGIEPSLLLWPENLTKDQWTVWLEIPDLSHLIDRFPETRETLTRSRCVVEGTSGRPLARGRLLYGTQRIKLDKWPCTTEVLLKFEHSNRQLDYLLHTECLLRPGTKRLFRIASDGLAYEMRSLRVRPREHYVLLSTADPFESEGNFYSLTNILCEGVHGTVLELPEAISADWEKFLQELGLEQSRKIEVWPAGLGAATWDGEGRAEWPAYEHPCLAIRTDHHVDSVLILMNGDTNNPLELTSVSPGEPIFVELPQLPVGRHVVNISVREKPAEERKPLGNVVIYIRPRSVSPRGPLLVRVSSPSPTLQEIWEGKVSISVSGPNGRKVKCRVSLFERDGGIAIPSEILPAISLPVAEDRWRAHFNKHFRDKQNAQKAYDTARSCEIEFLADELGTFTVRCEEDFKPLRWRLKQRDQKYFLWLFDDSGDDKQPAVSLMEFKTPCVENRLPFKNEYEVPDSGGMYAARTENFEAAIVVPPRLVGLEGLSCKPCVEKRERSMDALVTTVGTAVLWGQARVAGNPLAMFRKRDVMRVLIRDIFRILCGKNWANAEREATEVDPKNSLEDLSNAVSKHPNIGKILLQEVGTLSGNTCYERVKRLASLVASLVRIQDLEWFAQFSLMLASNPANAENWAGKHLREGLERIFDETILTKAARFLVIATDRHLCTQTDTEITPEELYAGWRWS